MNYDLKYWDELELKTIAKTVDIFDESIREKSALMIEAMIDLRGVGLAANQIGFRESILVYRLDEDDEPKTLVNAKIVKLFPPKIKLEEGCLSIPEFALEIPRYEKIIVEAQDLNGKELTIEVDGLHAQILQHEIDHLNGIRIIDRLGSTKKKLFIKYINKIDLERNHENASAAEI